MLTQGLRVQVQRFFAEERESQPFAGEFHQFGVVCSNNAQTMRANIKLIQERRFEYKTSEIIEAVAGHVKHTQFLVVKSFDRVC